MMKARWTTARGNRLAVFPSWAAQWLFSCPALCLWYSSFNIHSLSEKQSLLLTKGKRSLQMYLDPESNSSHGWSPRLDSNGGVAKAPCRSSCINCRRADPSQLLSVSAGLYQCGVSRRSEPTRIKRFKVVALDQRDVRMLTANQFFRREVRGIKKL